MTQPQRIQLRRTAGWRKPEGAVVVSRPSRWSNPFQLRKVTGASTYDVVTTQNGPDGTLFKHWAGPLSRADALAQAVELFELHIGPIGSYEYDEATLADLSTALSGKDLACWCRPEDPCHAEMLLRLANPPR